MYYLWKMLGYNKDDLIYYSANNIKDKLIAIESIRKTMKEDKTLSTRFIDDALKNFGTPKIQIDPNLLISAKNSLNKINEYDI